MAESTPPPIPDDLPESPANLRLPLAILAVLALGIGGFLLFGKGCFAPGKAEEKPISEEKLVRYREGDIFRTLVNTSVHGTVEDVDWAMKGSGTFIYQGELDTIREVRKNEKRGAHTEVTMDLQIRRARDLQIGIDLTDVTLDIPPMAGNLLAYGINLLPDVKIGQKIAVSALRRQWVRGALIDLVGAAIEKTTGSTLEEFILPAPPSIEPFEGAGATFVYRADVGLADVKTRGQLSTEQEQRLKDFSVFAESYILPAPDGKPGDEWEVDVTKIAHLLVPTSQIDAAGTLTLRRGESQGDTVDLEIIRGLVEFSGTSSSAKTLGSWAARGTLTYHLAENTVVAGHLTGAVKIDRSSTDHILFESKWTAAPEYTVLIHGYRATSREDAEKEIEPFQP